MIEHLRSVLRLQDFVKIESNYEAWRCLDSGGVDDTRRPHYSNDGFFESTFVSLCL